MFNDPEFANKEEWDAYAWFGFALSEAQTIEMLLQVVATAISMNTMQSTDRSRHWATLYDSFGRLTLGTLLNKVKSYNEVQLSEDLVQMLYEVRDIRNRLAHSFFRPSDSAVSNTDTLGMVTRELQAAASSFRHASTRLEVEVYGILDQLRVTRVEAEARLAKRLNEEDSGGDVH